jgi:hypothetical protein
MGDEEIFVDESRTLGGNGKTPLVDQNLVG